MAISSGISVSTSWVMNIEVLGLGSRIFVLGPHFAMPEKSGEERKCMCLTIPELSISSSYFILKCRSLYILCFDTRTNNHVLILVFLDERAKACFYCIY